MTKFYAHTLESEGPGRWQAIEDHLEGVARLARKHAEDFASAPGRGVTARVEGLVVRVGSPALLADLTALTADPDLDLALKTVETLEASGRTAVVVLLDDRPVGVLGLADRLRSDARATVAALTALTGAVPVLLTGDNPGAAHRLGIDGDRPRRLFGRVLDDDACRARIRRRDFEIGRHIGLLHVRQRQGREQRAQIHGEGLTGYKKREGRGSDAAFQCVETHR